jgi:hypothetical protein
MCGDQSVQPHLVIRFGLGSLVTGMFGMGWLGWGLGTANAFTPAGIVVFDVVGILLLGSSIYFIRKGRFLSRNYPAPINPLKQSVNKQFAVVVILEFAAIIIVGKIAYAIHRADLAPVLAATVVGLHFLFLAKIFRQPRYYVWGIAMALWCGVCAILFRSNSLIAWSNIGTGLLLWSTSADGILRARKIVRAFAH